MTAGAAFVAIAAEEHRVRDLLADINRTDTALPGAAVASIRAAAEDLADALAIAQAAMP